MDEEFIDDGQGKVTVDEVRIGLFRVLWKYFNNVGNMKDCRICRKFRLSGLQFDSDFMISRKKESIGRPNVITLKFISCSDRSTSKPEDEQSKSKRIKLEEESVSPKLRSLPPIKVLLFGERVPQTQYIHGKWKFNHIQTLEGGNPFVEFLIDFGTNELVEKLVTIQMGRILHNQTLCDVIFKFKNGEEIGAHVAILTAGSPVFAAMLQTDFVESKPRIVNIADIDMDVFKEMLTYMYTGKAPNLVKKNFARSVYEIADKYDIEFLKKVCEDLLVTQLSNSNAVELLVWAQFYSLPKLIEKTVQFIAKNSEELCSQPEWLDFMVDHPKLCLKIMQKMAKFVLMTCSDSE